MKRYPQESGGQETFPESKESSPVTLRRALPGLGRRCLVPVVFRVLRKSITTATQAWPGRSTPLNKPPQTPSDPLHLHKGNNTSFGRGQSKLDYISLIITGSDSTCVIRADMHTVHTDGITDLSLCLRLDSTFVLFYLTRHAAIPVLALSFAVSPLLPPFLLTRSWMSKCWIRTL